MKDNNIKTAKISGFDNYIAYSNGQIYSLSRNKFLKAFPNKNNKYLQVTLQKDGKHKLLYVHRLIYESFTGPIENGKFITHKDGDLSNNDISNLCIRPVNYARKKPEKMRFIFKRYNLDGELEGIYNLETLAMANYKKYSVVAASNSNYVNGGKKTNIYKNSTWKVVRG